MRPILTALLCLALPGAAVAQATPAEQMMMRTVEAEHDRHAPVAAGGGADFEAESGRRVTRFLRMSM